MHIDVIVLYRRTAEAVDTWRYTTDTKGRLLALHADNIPQPPEKVWQRLALTVNENAYDNLHQPLDVFLLFRASLLENLYYYEHLEEIIKDARNHTWGGNIYIVWDQDAGFERFYKYATVLQNWFQMISQSGVTDLIEIPKKIRKNEPDEYKILHDLARQSEEKLRRLRQFVSREDWGALLSDEAWFLKEFIDKLVEAKILPAHCFNQAVFYDHRKQRDRLTLLLEKADHFYRGGNRFVTTVPGIDTKVLEALWKLKPVQFNGVFEWLYALIRLNQAGSLWPTATPAASDSNEQQKEQIAWVEPSGNIAFQATPNNADLRLLVTSAFHPIQEEKQSLEAAKEIGIALHKLPFHVDVDIHPCIICERLPDLLEGKLFTAWLHISHGDRVQGLYEAQTRQYASADRWVTCFTAYAMRGSLQLVILSACQSATIAKLLAASGVRVAIGFENNVLTAAARKVTEKVLTAAMQSGDRQSPVLVAFQEAYNEVSSRTLTRLRFSDAWPKAFASKLKPK